MQSLRSLRPDAVLRVYSATPQWFFHDSVGETDCRPLETDVGLVQKTPLQEDLPATLERLRSFLPFDRHHVAALAREVADLSLLVCDISPLGLAIARSAGVPSVLLENFTWDWIYRAYVDEHPALERFVGYLEAIYARVDVHIQARPLCRPAAGARTVDPISRHLREPREQMRSRLHVPEEMPLVLVSMGGVPASYPFLERLRGLRDWACVISGAAAEARREGNLILLPGRSDYYHPDLVNACDALIAKAGYSTLAEARQAGVPVGWLGREHFPESPILGDYLRRELPSLALDVQDWNDGGWIKRVPDLLALGPRRPARSNGADQAAGILLELLS